MANDEEASGGNTPPRAPENAIFRAKMEAALSAPPGLIYKRVEVQFRNRYWPLGLCAAWIIARDPAQTVSLYSARRLSFGLYQDDRWSEARLELHRALIQNTISASALSKSDGKRTSIPAANWIDLALQFRGAEEEAIDRTNVCVFFEILIDADAVRTAWPAPRPAAEPALDEPKSDHRAKAEARKLCREALERRMRLDPLKPTAKHILRLEYPHLSFRAFEAAFADAVRHSGAWAWSRAGRRPKKRG